MTWSRMLCLNLGGLGVFRYSGIRGATPVQNVGAYGVEVADTMTRSGCSTAVTAMCAGLRYPNWASAIGTAF